jgi:hypothetical protein
VVGHADVFSDPAPTVLEIRLGVIDPKDYSDFRLRLAGDLVTLVDIQPFIENRQAKPE